MKFEFYLYIVYIWTKLGMGFTARINKDFRKALNEASFTSLIRTKDGKAKRSYIFHKGKISTIKGGIDTPDLQVIWQDEETAMKLANKLNDPKTFMKALAEGSLSFKGSASAMFRFMLLIRQMARVYGR